MYDYYLGGKDNFPAEPGGGRIGAFPWFHWGENWLLGHGWTTDVSRDQSSRLSL
jgi:hypothetical protein